MPYCRVNELGPGRDVAVDQDDLGLEALVVDVEPVDHVRRSVVGRLGLEEELGVAVAPRLVGPALRLHELGGLGALEDVAEAGREREVHVVEVRHVGDVVDQLAAVGALDRDGVPAPGRVGLVGLAQRLADTRQLRRQDAVVGRRSLGVVPHQQLAVADGGLVAVGARAQRDPPGVRDLLALAVAAPAPVVERAGDLVALDLALGEVAAHVPAVAVEGVEVALAVLPDHQLGAEPLDRVRFAVGERRGQPEAVPTAGEADRRRPVVETAHIGLGGVTHVEHVTVLPVV